VSGIHILRSTALLKVSFGEKASTNQNTTNEPGVVVLTLNLDMNYKICPVTWLQKPTPLTLPLHESCTACIVGVARECNLCDETWSLQVRERERLGESFTRNYP